ncbi:hypothetical protein BZG36_02757 [Bifiguratus adelaidae]|uniref:Fe2OG dioxygenase domain-containing protein n=1 Tax=Bifiguratus adelaidae TaxID=1938954 RepID=A0A261Y1T8_9FUNG|nr:hypothetical protein BZG36_02757 [Bifiguratus adelaidae]
MGKQGKERKRRRLLQPIEDDVVKENVEYDGMITASDMAITLRTLKALEYQPEQLHKKEFKQLKAEVHTLYTHITAKTGQGTTLSGRISDALTDGRWADALGALTEMRARGQVPKLGALQRWVRDCDAASARDGTFGNPQVLRVLDSILRTADPALVPTNNDEHPVRQHEAWSAIERTSSREEIYASALAGTLFDEAQAEKYRRSFRIVAHEKGSERRTPNQHDFTLYYSQPGTIITLNGAEQPVVGRVDVPNVPGAFVLTNVLTPDICKQILSAAESIGFTPDAPIVGAAKFLNYIFNRCQPHLPQEIQGGAVTGLNARWRVYRYVPGAIYRPHIDGAWPGSGLDPKTGAYLYDAYDGKQWSRLTFLIYLNDEFDGGATTFFMPAAQEGTLDARPVSPRQGSVLCFPHGNTKGSLLHEGSPVTRGAKYVIRTDVLYMV